MLGLGVGVGDSVAGGCVAGGTAAAAFGPKYTFSGALGSLKLPARSLWIACTAWAPFLIPEPEQLHLPEASTLAPQTGLAST